MVKPAGVRDHHAHELSELATLARRVFGLLRRAWRAGRDDLAREAKRVHTNITDRIVTVTTSRRRSP